MLVVVVMRNIEGQLQDLFQGNIKKALKQQGFQEKKSYLPKKAFKKKKLGSQNQKVTYFIHAL